MAGRRYLAVALSLLLFAGCTQAADKQEPAGCGDDSSNQAACGFDTVTTQPDENGFLPLSFDEAISFFENGKTGLLYFGFPDCPWCQEVVPILKEEAKKAGVDVYYVRTRDDDHERLYSDEQKEKIQPYIESYMKENDQGVMTLYVPLILSVDQGKATAGHQGTVDGHNAKAEKMTPAQKEEVEVEIQVVVDAALQAKEDK